MPKTLCGYKEGSVNLSYSPCLWVLISLCDVIHGPAQIGVWNAHTHVHTYSNNANANDQPGYQEPSHIRGQSEGTVWLKGQHEKF